MQQVVFHKFTDTKVRYEFRLRNYPESTLCSFEKEIKKEIDNLCKLRFREEELDYLKTIPFLSDDYIDFLRMFQFKRDDINTYNSYVTGRGKFFQLVIEGSWLNTILFETPVLAIISEVFSKRNSSDNLYPRLSDKIEILENLDDHDIFNLVDFGTRRRYSFIWHDRMIQEFVRRVPHFFIGTSNVYLAKKHNIKPIGTMAHEYQEAMQALVRLEDSQKYALQCWADEYRGRLGIALSDTLGIDCFLNDFDLYFAKLFDGVRQDSGDPYLVANKVINHYRKLGILPKTKTIVFSDGLTIEKALLLNDSYSPLINCSFGVGTHLTNDTGFKAPQIVIKMTKCNDRPVAKISDSRGKQMCNDKNYLRYLASVFNITREDIYE